MWNRLPTVDNLQKRVDVDNEVGVCCCCQLEEETAKHLFLECTEVISLWYKMTAWVGASWAAPRSIETHLRTFQTYLVNGNGIHKKRLRIFMSVCGVGVVEVEKNGEIRA